MAENAITHTLRAPNVEKFIEIVEHLVKLQLRFHARLEKYDGNYARFVIYVLAQQGEDRNV